MKAPDQWLVRLRALLGSAVVAWELGVDHLQHWPPTLILAFWLLGGPVEELIRFLTAGRLQINVKQGAEAKDDSPDDETDETEPDS